MPYERPAQIPSIILPDCVLLPHCVLPLHIFEERYRKMVKDALSGNRLFAVACLDETSNLLEDSEKGEPLGCVGMIRACISNSDGTSNLMLQGVQRVRFLNWHSSDDYPTSDVEWIEDDDSCPDADRLLSDQLIETVDELISDDDQAARAFVEHLRSFDNAGAVADLVAYHFLGSDHQTMRQVLAETHSCDRLALVIDQITSADIGKS